MSQLDQDAAIAANEQFEACLDMDKGLYVATCSAIRAYRQAECKSFKDAPRDGTKVEAWHELKEEWISIHHSHGRWTLTGRSLDWDTEDGLKAFTHYRLPFNPEAPGD